MAAIGFSDDFLLHDGEISSAELKVFDNLDGETFCLPDDNAQFSFIDLTQPPPCYPCQTSYSSQSLSSPDNIEIASFPTEKCVGDQDEVVCQNFEHCEPRESHSSSAFKRIRSGDEDGILEFQSKRKKNVNEKPSQAQKIIIEVESQELLEDGYKWRKYGEKSMENCRMRRCYYKCSDKKCSVKKRIERKPLEDEILLITYEGVHNHRCPNPVYYVNVEKRVYIPIPDTSNNY